MLKSRANVKRVSATAVPRVLCGWFGMHNNLASWRAHWVGIKVEGTVSMFPGGECWSGPRVAEEVKGELRLWEQQVPSIFRE